MKWEGSGLSLRRAGPSARIQVAEARLRGVGVLLPHWRRGRSFVQYGIPSCHEHKLLAPMSSHISPFYRCVYVKHQEKNRIYKPLLTNRALK
jgi:hypothetical protein